MNFSDLHIDYEIQRFIQNNVNQFTDWRKANDFIYKTCGVLNFFCKQEQVEEIKYLTTEKELTIQEPDRRDYGDFQTNEKFTIESINYILSRNPDFDYELVFEPTCGKGNFILAALKLLPNIKKIIGIEIYEPYIWETKFNILQFFLENPLKAKPNIEIIEDNFFEFDLNKLARETKYYKTLIIGNPPWVTNTELSSINSKNLPKKSNIKNYKGLDAITGKSNFDIGEYIAGALLENFNKHDGSFGFLIKNSVVRNLIYEQKNDKYRISGAEKLNIDSKKEFNASVDASLFVVELNKEPQKFCQEKDFYTREIKTRFGWRQGHFVYSINDYAKTNSIEGKSQFVWRQGVKHDCSKILEIEEKDGYYINGLNQRINIEPVLVYGLLKGSDLKASVTDAYRKLIIVTQKKIGQDTSFIKRDYPLTFDYLSEHKSYFDKRKSSIYKDKPPFSIFGVGDYSFKPYKVGVSGFSKKASFTLILPSEGKPLMLDDTCYFIGFDNLAYAQIAHSLLNHETTRQFLNSIIFPDSKRPITKEILMRIDFRAIYDSLSYGVIKDSITDLDIKEWEAFGNLLSKTNKSKQAELF